MATSADSRATWDTVGSAKNYFLTGADIGKPVTVSTSYSDDNGLHVQVNSGVVVIAQPQLGIDINPMILAAPSGTNVKRSYYHYGSSSDMSWLHCKFRGSVDQAWY